MKEAWLSPEQEKIPSFEDQFDKREKIDILEGTVEVVDIKPEQQKTNIPVLFAPGWGETLEVFKDSLKVMASLNRRVMSLSHARGGNGREQKNPLPTVELRKALALLKVIEEKNFAKIDVVAHSEGAINTIIAASLRPKKFHNIILMAPGGMMGKDKFPKLAGRFSLNLIRSAIRMITEPRTRKPLGQLGRESARYVAQNPLLALREAKAISASEIHSILKELHEQGIGISIIHGVDDPVFPMKEIQKIAAQDQLDGFYSVTGEHNELYLHPEKYIRLADEALNALDAKRSANLQPTKTPSS